MRATRVAPGASESDCRTRPLCIDLDGTLVRSDLLAEAVLRLVKRNALYALLLPLWLFAGKARLKQMVADRVDLDVSLLPYNEPLLEYLRTQHAEGRRLILTTASNEKYAQQVAAHLGLFDQVFASDARINLSGRQKRDRLVAAFGDRGFDYAANESKDLSVWSHARAAILVDAPSGVTARLRTPVTRVFASPRPGPKAYLKAIRVHQWLKNLLVFVPIVAGHQFVDLRLLLQTTIAFIVFSLCASSVYVLNDLLDLNGDRRHLRKRHRAFAAGDIPIQQGLLLIPLLLGAALALAALLPPRFLGALGTYYAITLAYSLRLKQLIVIDVLVLAALYTLRVIGGGVATGLVLSFWLLAFSMFLFFSLALVKRYSELTLVRTQNQDAAAGRGYQVSDLDTLAQFGVVSGCSAVLVLALYINSSAVLALYRHPEVLWLMCPLLFYWVTRLWLLARREAIHEDPVVFAIEDRQSHWLLVALAAIAWFAA